MFHDSVLFFGLWLFFDDLLDIANSVRFSGLGLRMFELVGGHVPMRILPIHDVLVLLRMGIGGMCVV